MNVKTMGQKLRKLRKLRGLTMVELAERLGITQAQISRLETGKQGFRSATLTKVAAALGVKPIWFFIEEQPRSGKKGAPEIPLDAVAGSALAVAFRDPSFREAIARAAEIFLVNPEEFNAFVKALAALSGTGRH